MKCLIAVFIVIVLLIVVAACLSKSETVSLEDDCITIVQLAFSAFNEGDFCSLSNLYSPDFLHHSPDSVKSIAWPEYELNCLIVRKQIPGLQYRIVDIFAFKNKVAVRSVWEYCNVSDQFRISFADGVAQGSAISIYRIENSMIIEEWCDYDPAPIKKFCSIYKRMVPTE